MLMEQLKAAEMSPDVQNDNADQLADILIEFIFAAKLYVQRGINDRHPSLPTFSTKTGIAIRTLPADAIAEIDAQRAEWEQRRVREIKIDTVQCDLLIGTLKQSLMEYIDNINVNTTKASVAHHMISQIYGRLEQVAHSCTDNPLSAAFGEASQRLNKAIKNEDFMKQVSVEPFRRRLALMRKESTPPGTACSC